MMSDASDIPYTVHGKYWQELSVGQKFRTHKRSLTETDLVNFINGTGMLESIFIDTTYEGAMSGRPVPAALTLSIIEGFLLQSVIQGVGLAMLELTLKPVAPVRVGDTIWAVMEVTSLRPTSKNNRAIVGAAITVYNQNGDTVLTYQVTRMQAGDPALAS
jgi:acyl dehydratase